MADPNPARTAKLAGSIKKAFGELFDFVPMAASADVNARKGPDGARGSMLGVTGSWDGPTDAKSPLPRDGANPKVAHNWAASFPSVTVYEADLTWMPRRGDKLVRKLDSSVFEVVEPFPDALGKVIVQLTNRARA